MAAADPLFPEVASSFYSLMYPLVSFQDCSSAGPVPTTTPRAAAVAGEQSVSPKIQLPLNV